MEVVGAVGVAQAGLTAMVTTKGACVASTSISQKEALEHSTEDATPTNVDGTRWSQARVGNCSGEAEI